MATKLGSVRKEPSARQQDSMAWAIVRRVVGSLGCGAIGGGLGFWEPVLWFAIWSVVTPGMFGKVFPQLALVVPTYGGVIAGCIVGLVAGWFAPNRVGLTVTLLGLGLLQLLGSMAFLFPLYSSNEAMRFGQLALLWPSIPANSVLAACCWILPPIRRVES